ncbi:MAG: UDP-N-acetylmuramoyl-L-alanine--D-glutamate ligase [Armatimonadetes bacterium]|nr:UDP-N-acetylmuramoyl-L-alanine--D-glutamate ligase [Armatimonadota bacterium]
MTSKSLAILGLGRSGVSVAKAALELGARPMVFDERPIVGAPKQEAARELEALGVPVQGDWNGSFTETGCDLIVTSPGVPMRSPRLQQAVEEGLEVLSEVEFAYRISKAPIVAITGTNGKSTTTAMTWLCLKAVGVDAVLCGNIAGSGYPEMPLTDAALHSTPDQVLVAEISSFQLEFVRDFKPIAATITTLTEDHLNRYKGFAEYAAMKHRIFRNMAGSGIAVWNLDDPATKPPEGVEVWGYRGQGENGENGETGENGESGERCSSPMGLETIGFLKILGREIAKAELPFSEPHNYRNALCAALLASAALEPHSQIHPLRAELLDGLKAFKPLEHRMELLGERGGVTVINNSMCTNPGAVIASSQSVEGPQRLLMGGENKELAFAPVKEYLDQSGHTAYLFGKDAQSINAQLGGRWQVFDTLSQAFLAACMEATRGDTIMLAPGVASTDQFLDFRDRGVQFRAMAKAWLDSP